MRQMQCGPPYDLPLHSLSAKDNRTVCRAVEIVVQQCYKAHIPSAEAKTARFLEDIVLSHSDPAHTDTSTGLPVGTRAARGEGDFTSEQMLATVMASIEDDKAEDVVQIDLRGRSDVADYMIVCSGRSTRQVAAIAEKLADRIKAEYRFTPKMEGLETGDWVLIDSFDVIVHVFRPEVRDFYQLEKIWVAGAAHRGA